MSLSRWLRSANKLAKQGKSKDQIIKDLGKPPGRITSNGDGGWKPPSGNRAEQARRRRNHDATSTDEAFTEAKQQHIQKRELNNEASLYGLEGFQKEHDLNQQSASTLQNGAPGDPDKTRNIQVSAARFKDKVELATNKTHFTTINGDGVRVVPHRFFDPIADPNSLPGVNIHNLNELAQFVAHGRTLSPSDALYTGLDVVSSNGGPVVGGAVEAFNALVDEPVRQATGKGVYEQIPNGTKEERRAKNEKINGDLKKNNGHNGNGNGHYITNQLFYMARKIADGQLPYNGD